MSLEISPGPKLTPNEIQAMKLLGERFHIDMDPGETVNTYAGRVYGQLNKEIVEYNAIRMKLNNLEATLTGLNKGFFSWIRNWNAIRKVKAEFNREHDQFDKLSKKISQIASASKEIMLRSRVENLPRGNVDLPKDRPPGGPWIPRSYFEEVQVPVSIPQSPQLSCVDSPPGDMSHLEELETAAEDPHPHQPPQVDLLLAAASVVVAPIKEISRATVIELMNCNEQLQLSFKKDRSSSKKTKDILLLQLANNFFQLKEALQLLKNSPSTSEGDQAHSDCSDLQEKVSVTKDELTEIISLDSKDVRRWDSLKETGAIGDHMKEDNSIRKACVLVGKKITAYLLMEDNEKWMKHGRELRKDIRDTLHQLIAIQDKGVSKLEAMLAYKTQKSNSESVIHVGEEVKVLLLLFQKASQTRWWEPESQEEDLDLSRFLG